MGKSLMRSLGEFVGHVARGFKTPVGKPRRHEVGRSIEEQRVETPRGPVTVRRTTIEEVELPPENKP